MRTASPRDHESITSSRSMVRALILTLLAGSLLLLWGCTMKPKESSPAPVAEGPGGTQEAHAAIPSETAEPIYDPGFLRLLASPSLPAHAATTPGLRRIDVSELTLRSGSAPVGEVKAGESEITLDISRQVLSLEVPEEREYSRGTETEEATLYPSFSEAGADASFTPAAALALKAKQFDDGLYACVEIAADSGLDQFPGRRQFLLSLLQGVSEANNRAAATFLTAAAHLGGLHPSVSEEVASQAQTIQSRFLADELRSKPLGFYTWNQDLVRIFQRDRLLQSPLSEDAARSVSETLAKNDELFKSYVASLTLNERLTNPSAGVDLRQAAMALKDGHTPRLAGGPALFPPSESQETNLVKGLFGSSPIPEGFNLADEMVTLLRAGQLTLKPKPNSGWYDYETYALEPLAIPDKMPEAQHIKFDESYRKELVGLFKALLALTRETHIKQLEIPTIGSAMPPRYQPIRISPDLTVEPLPTYYLRRARSYQFVRDVLRQAFGSDTLPKLRRLTATGPVNLPLDSELTLMEALFHGAYLQSCQEIGMIPESSLKPVDAHLQVAVLQAWIESIPKDPDLGKDIRMMVPVFYDVGRGRIKVWAVLGVASKHLSVSYAKPPVVREVKGPGGERVNPGDLDVEFIPQYAQYPYIVSAEVYVSRLLNRTEFRRLCDQKKSFRAIVEGLKQENP